MKRENGEYITTSELVYLIVATAITSSTLTFLVLFILRLKALGWMI